MTIANVLLTLSAFEVCVAASGNLRMPAFMDQVKYAETAKKDALALRTTNSSIIDCEWGIEEYCYDENGTDYCANISEGGCECKEGEVKCGGDDYWTGYCTTLCCEAGDETCFDVEGNPSYCADIESGGCPCPEGQEKCFSSYGGVGYCSPVCCDDYTQETCYSEDWIPVSCANFTEGGCPCEDGEIKCGGTDYWAGYCTTLCCDSSTEETCYDENGEASYCALYTDGGCPCPDGEVKCGYYEGWGGYCTSVCCDDSTEETCYSQDTWEPESCALISDGGCPCQDGQVKCGGYDGYSGYCTTLCCDETTEETCYSQDTLEPESCALISDGGCPCPDGETKCGAFPGYAGYCTPVCCDDAIEETCYTDSWEPESCALIADGGCPCPDKETKCGMFPGYAGYCSPVCCDYNTEETCYSSDTFEPEYCALISDGGCPCSDGEVKCGSFPGYAGYCTPICCDDATEETCYSNVTWVPESCALISDGGCLCPEGQSKCGASEGYAGYCTELCCSDGQEYCYDDNGSAYCAAFSDGGCPCQEGEVKCGAYDDYPGYCTRVCCTEDQEYCYDWTEGEYCADYSDGGCPCGPDEVKCGASEDYPGYCTTICCDESTEEYCYDENWQPYCASYTDGGCPCGEGTEKCGAEGDYPGWCSSICCDLTTEEPCFDEYWNVKCVSLDVGGCPCQEGEVKCGGTQDYPGFCTEVCCEKDEMTCYDEEWIPASCVNLDEECPLPLRSKIEEAGHIGSLAHYVSLNPADSFHAMMQQTKPLYTKKVADEKNFLYKLKHDKALFYRAVPGAFNAITETKGMMKTETSTFPSTIKMKERQLLAKKSEEAFLRAMNPNKRMVSVVNGVKQQKEHAFLHAFESLKRALLKKNVSPRNVERILQEKKSSLYHVMNDIF